VLSGFCRTFATSQPDSGRSRLDGFGTGSLMGCCRNGIPCESSGCKCNRVAMVAVLAVVAVCRPLRTRVRLM
jgi:hypothetical protein